MRLPFRSPRPWAVEPLETADLQAAARLHAEGFSRAWSAHEFADLLAQPAVFGFGAREEGQGRRAELLGFVLARIAGGEGEILTLAVHAPCRGRGLGWLLMNAVLGLLHRERAEALFLEVDETNEPALRLYRRLGFRTVGKRPHYYRDASAPGRTALVMRRDLSAG